MTQACGRVTRGTGALRLKLRRSVSLLQSWLVAVASETSSTQCLTLMGILFSTRWMG